MRKIATIFFLVIFITAKSQIGYSDYYTEKDLLANLQKAKSPAEQIEATGILMNQSQIRFKDSLAAAYMDKIHKIAANSGDGKLVAQAMLWDYRFKFDTLKVNKLLQYALQHNLAEYKILSKLTLGDYYIHHNLTLAEKNGLDAKKYWEDWKTDSVSKDSLKLKLYRVLSHIYIHKRDGINVSQYLLPLIDYASQDRNESIKAEAMDVLASMYSEWPGKEKVATEWVARLYEHYKKTNQKNQLLMMTGWLGQRMSALGDKEKARGYFNELEKLMDSLGVYGYFQVYTASSTYGADIITLSQYMDLLDNNFNGRLILPLKEIIKTKVGVYNQVKNWDSVIHYLSRYKKIIGDSAAREDNFYKYYMALYYEGTKQFDQAIPIVKSFLAFDEKSNDTLNIKDNCWWLKDLYSGKKEYKTAYDYFARYEKLRADVQQRENNETTASMNMQKQIDLQQAAFDEQKKLQQAEQEREASRSRLRVYTLLGGMALLLLIAGLLWRNNRQKQKAKTEIEKAYSDLKSAQAQLIQSEKMASLGELTAGIAHEIQNPLNFVNNFSEVNKELVDELRNELATGNMQSAKEIADDIKANEEKINHHGKRADSIVKGMLQHSRSNTGQKEPTDINALADEYLRLAYHGLRAKDKTFNATTITEFDNSIGKLNIVPQDIGRVILNLINNAFYAVDERKKVKLSTMNYEPTVIVSTKNEKDKIEIKVKDNGDGIPQNVLAKIFQPFFTTKPTGQGTGLGLSLAYDIVKAHGGELKVETKEGEGSEFIIQLNSIKSEPEA